MSTSMLIDGPGLWAYNVELSKGRETTLGRGRGNEVVLADEKVSGKHAVVLWVGNRWVVRDLKSSNGTFVNGVRVTEADLRDGDKILFGSTDVLFKDKASRANDDAWGKTVMRIEKHELALRGAIEKAKPEEVVVIPDLHLVSPAAAESLDDRPEDSAPSSFFDNNEFASNRYVAPRQESTAAFAKDMLWAAERMATILGELAHVSDRSKRGMYTAALGKLREVIGAENGFVMIPNRETKRWVIEAWVGNAAEWTSYEKEHPVSLTVANEAFSRDEVVSNAYTKIDGSDPVIVPASVSMLKLNIQVYIAVPLKRNGQKDGVIYFDIRRAIRKFEERDVLLIQRVGNYLLELNARIRE